MLKKKIVVLGFVCVFVALSLMSTASATNFSFKRSMAFGTGSFIHDHEGVPHTHYFAFSVSDGYTRRDGWNYNPQGAFYMLVTHDGDVHMIVKSDQIQSFKVMRVEGGLSMVMEGVATVKHMDADWEKGWMFTVEAFDSNVAGKDSIHVTFVAPDGMEHDMEGTLISGNIVIKK